MALVESAKCEVIADKTKDTNADFGRQQQWEERFKEAEWGSYENVTCDFVLKRRLLISLPTVVEVLLKMMITEKLNRWLTFPQIDYIPHFNWIYLYVWSEDYLLLNRFLSDWYFIPGRREICTKKLLLNELIILVWFWVGNEGGGEETILITMTKTHWYDTRERRTKTINIYLHSFVTSGNGVDTKESQDVGRVGYRIIMHDWSAWGDTRNDIEAIP